MKLGHKRYSLLIALPLVLLVSLAAVTPAFALDGGPTDDLTLSLNIMWMIIGGFLVFFMQAGFALVETGFTRNKNVAHTMLMNMMVFCIGAIGYWICGFAFQFGAVNHSYPEVNGNAAWAFSPITLG